MAELRKEFIDYNSSIRNVTPYYITIHDTGDPGASDENEHNYFAGGNRGASADVFIDKDSATQIIDTDKYYSWHCGDGAGRYGIKNSNSLGIEMCLEEDGTLHPNTIVRTLEIVKYFMSKYNIPIERVVRHYDASRKCCPSSMSANNWAKWFDFKDKLINGKSSSGRWILDREDNKWWYLRSNNSYPQDCWEKIEDKWYLFDESGWMLFDWKSDDGKWYYLGESNDGAMKTGWIYDKQLKSWYFLNASGAMATGWLKDKDRWYYLDKSGAMKTGWIQDKEKWYLLDSNGIMYQNTTAYGYAFNNDGIATKI